MTEQELIKSIRSEYSGLQDLPRTSLSSSVEALANDLYAKDTHFVFELIQNAEDNDYAQGITPTVRFKVMEFELGTDRQIALIIENNEKGFFEEHVKAICQVGKSTKTKSEGYIGEKGIGFKSVFRITNSPHIFSNRFNFALPEKDDETGLGYIVPKWVDNIPTGIEQDWTTIVLPINKGRASVEQVTAALRDIAPETILFLEKLRSIEIQVATPYDNYEIMLEKDGERSPLIELTYLKRGNSEREELKTSLHWLTWIEFDKPKNIEHEKRQGITKRKVYVALPLDEGSCQEKLFAYLPVWEENTGLPFLINADFLLTSSRESIHEDEAWNQWLRNSIAPVYRQAFLSCLQSNTVSTELKATLYASIPVESHREFLRPVVEQIQTCLREVECVQTLPDRSIAVPSMTRLATKAFRKLLNNAVEYPDYFKDRVHLVHTDIEGYSKQLKSIGVEELHANEIVEWLKNAKWLRKQSVEWFVRLYRYLSSQHLADNALDGLPLVPVAASEGAPFVLSCNREQPICFSCDESTHHSLSSLPNWLSELVPVAFLAPALLRVLEEQEDCASLKKWLTEQLGVSDLSIEDYCENILSRLAEEYTCLDTKQLTDATEFIVQHAGSEFPWDQLPVVLSDGSKMLLREVRSSTCRAESNGSTRSEVQALVVPENYDPESGWQHIWRTEDDRDHFVWLSEDYSRAAIEKLLKCEHIDKYPLPRKRVSRYMRITVTKVEIEYLAPKGPLNCAKAMLGWLNYMGNKEDAYVNWPTDTYDYDFKGEYAEFEWGCRREYYEQNGQTYYVRTGRYQFKCGESEFLKYIRSEDWLPTTKGFVRPSQAFLPREDIKEILGDTVPYFEDKMPQNIIDLLGICSELNVTKMLDMLKECSGDSGVRIEMVRSIYRQLESRSSSGRHPVGKIKVGFSTHDLVFVPSEEGTGGWHKIEDCVWGDSSEVLGDDFVYLEKHYPELKGFFCDILGVKEKADKECFSLRWLKLQESPLRDKDEQRRLVEQLYRELRPIAEMDTNDRPDWWVEFSAKAKVYTQSNTFEVPDKVVVPDDGVFRDVFRHSGICFAWRPPNDSFRDWRPFYEAFEIPFLSASVTMKLAEDADYAANEHNVYLTESSVKMIAAWLREKQQTIYRRLLENDVFEELLMTKEANTEQPATVRFTLDAGILHEDVESQFPVFWHRDTNPRKLIVSNSEDKRRMVEVMARHLAQKILDGRDYRELAHWIELVLGTDDTERLNWENWSVPHEITALCRTDQPSPRERPPEAPPHWGSLSEGRGKEDSEHQTGSTTCQVATKNRGAPPRTRVFGNKGPCRPSAGQTSSPSRPEDRDPDSRPALPAGGKPRADAGLSHSDSSEQTTQPARIDYKKLLRQSFNRPGKTKLEDEFINDGKVTNPDRRRERSYDEHQGRLDDEPSPDKRRKDTIRAILEQPDEQVREYLSQMYGGKCQICNRTFPERDGNPFFVANYIVPRKVARAIDTPANALCLCAEHFGKWQHGSIEAENVLEQIEAFKTESEGEESAPVLQLKVCGEECRIVFKEKHLVHLQELLRASSEQK